MNKDIFMCLVRHSLPPSSVSFPFWKRSIFSFHKLRRCCTMLLFLTYY
ncbi:acetyltransferase [Brevibacillus laterosporus]|nr:acetyltransferase [Brevibacillus laterosporus]MDF9410146.1 acetyltransferase [Brevibacillus laterosporus]RJL12045.1 acetyltransferase [Brevibacillus laterosporus]TPH19678.1 acetyltransferase [Brevibacillus laterosporus]